MKRRLLLITSSLLLCLCLVSCGSNPPSNETPQTQNSENEIIKCDKVIISTGSKAYPKTGSEGDGYNFANKLDINVNKVYPALVALTSSNKMLKDLDGVRTNAKVTLFKDNKIIFHSKNNDNDNKNNSFLSFFSKQL